VIEQLPGKKKALNSNPNISIKENVNLGGEQLQGQAYLHDTSHNSQISYQIEVEQREL
jgi:hypothetical protein